MNSSELMIRDYCNEDYNGLMALWQATDMGSSIRGDTSEIIDRTITMGGKLLVMENKNSAQIIGSSWMTFDGRRIMLHHFGILPEFQGLGLSKLLLKKSMGFVKEKGVQVKLEVHSSNYKAIKLYSSFGFRHLGEFMVYIIRDVSIL